MTLLGKGDIVCYACGLVLKAELELIICLMPILWQRTIY